MRKSSNKTRNASSTGADDNFSLLQLQLELVASKAKNSKLTQALAKTLYEKFEMNNENVSLKHALVDLQMERNRLELELKKLTESIRKCIPSLSDLLNLFLQCTSEQMSKSSFAAEHLSDKDYFKVNGADLNPTILLPQLIVNNNPNKTSIDYKTSLPLSSNSSNENCENGGSSQSCDTNGECLLTTKTITSTQLVTSYDAALQLIENDYHHKELSEISKESELERRFTTILEESMSLANVQARTSLEESRLYVSKYLTEDLQDKTFNESTYVNVNDTCLNMETTVVEDQETGVSGRLKADIKLISSHSNFTRLDADKSMFVDISKGNLSSREEPQSVVPSVSAISSEVSMVSDGLNEPEGHVTSNALVELTAPSLLVLSEPEILTESGRKSSPMLYCASSLRSKTRRKPVNEEADESPRSSRQSHMNRRSLSVITRHQPESGEINLTLVVLERVDISTKQDCFPILNIVEDSDMQNKLRKPKVKCKKTCKRNLFQDKISDVQTGRSNYVPESSSDRPEPATNSSARPHRAAKPKILKDASLKIKLRRMV